MSDAVRTVCVGRPAHARPFRAVPSRGGATARIRPERARADGCSANMCCCSSGWSASCCCSTARSISGLPTTRTRRRCIRIQQEKAASAARRIEEFVDEIERQLGWTTAPQWAAAPLEQRRFDYVRLLRQVPPITELIQLDDTGKEQLKVSRLAMDVVGSEKDYSQSPSFTEAQQASASGSARSISARNPSRT